MLKQARKIALRSTCAYYHHAAIVTRGGAVIATGYNHRRIHAEVHALSSLWPSERVGTTVWSLRFTKNGMGNAKPCPSCEAYMREAGVKVCRYSGPKGVILRLKF